MSHILGGNGDFCISFYDNNDLLNNAATPTSHLDIMQFQ